MYFFTVCGCKTGFWTFVRNSLHGSPWLGALREQIVNINHHHYDNNKHAYKNQFARFVLFQRPPLTLRLHPVVSRKNCRGPDSCISPDTAWKVWTACRLLVCTLFLSRQRRKRTANPAGPRDYSISLSSRIVRTKHGKRSPNPIFDKGLKTISEDQGTRYFRSNRFTIIESRKLYLTYKHNTLTKKLRNRVTRPLIIYPRVYVTKHYSTFILFSIA